MFQRRIMERDIPNVKLISPKGNPIIAEWAMLRERKPGEAIHLRREDSCPVCCVCGQAFGIFLDSEHNHSTNPAACRKE